MSFYSSGKDIINKYDKLYNPVFIENYLYHIFNDEHDYDISDTEISNENIMLTMGHYFSLEEEDLNKAKFFYNKVTSLGSAYGLYSLGVFFYTKKMYSRAKLYAVNGVGMDTKGSLDCLLLLHKISIEEGDFERAEKYFVDEIEKIDKRPEKEFDKISIVENLCVFYLTTLKNENKFIELATKYVNQSWNIRSILAKYYYDIHDVDSLLTHTEFMMANKMTIGNYFKGMHSYLQFVIMCKHGLDLKTINEAIELLEISETWFETISMSNEVQSLKDSSIGMIHRIFNWKNQIEKIVNESNQSAQQETIVVV